MDEKEKITVTPPITPIQDHYSHMIEYTTEIDESDYELFRTERKRQKKALDNTTPFFSPAEKEPKDSSMFGKIANKLFFSTPKPVRPQLHAFF